MAVWSSAASCTQIFSKLGNGQKDKLLLFHTPSIGCVGVFSLMMEKQRTRTFSFNELINCWLQTPSCLWSQGKYGAYQRSCSSPGAGLGLLWLAGVAAAFCLEDWI